MKRYLAISLLLTLAIGLTSCTNNTTTTTSNVLVKTQTVSKESLNSTIDIAGALNPNNTQNVALKMTGIVKELNVQPGDTVKKGDVLVTLETKELEASLAQANAQYKGASDNAQLAKVNLNAANAGVSVTNSTINDQKTQAEISVDAAQKGLDAANAAATDQLSQAQLSLDNAQQNYDRQKPLFDAGTISKATLDSASNQLDAANSAYNLSKTSTDSAIIAAQAKLDAAKATLNQTLGSSSQGQIVAAKSKLDAAKTQYEISSTSTLDSAKAAINSIEVQLDNAKATANINGVIVNKNINQGEMAAAGTPLLTIADISTLRLKGTIPQDAIPFVKKGQDINVLVDIYPNKVFKGKIDLISPISVASSSYFPVEITIENTDNTLLAGLSAHGSVDITGTDNITVPNSSIVSNNGQTYVFIIENGIAIKKDVTIGLKNDTNTEIINGIDEGAEVATSNVMFSLIACLWK